MTDTDGSTQKKVCVACGKEYVGLLTACPTDGTTLTPLKETNLIGTTLGDRYEIQELLGDGAMGQVYKARHKLLKRTVAVKMMHPNLVSGAAALKRFQKEAELASAFNHPNILTVHDFGVTDDGVPYLVMAYLEGTSLSTEISGGKHLELKRSIHIFKQVCLGLAHAHERGVIHRDLKPSNIMMVQLDNDPDFVKIVDFGIAKLLTPAEGETDNLTRTGEVFGSPPYMSPEQCRALPVDARCDIYSLGCVMYRTVSGKQPITGHDLIEYLYKHVNEMPAGFDEVCPELHIPKELERIIFKALAKQPDDRHQSMNELRAALDEIYQTIPGESMTRTDIPRLVIPDGSDSTEAERTRSGQELAVLNAVAESEKSAAETADKNSVESARSTVSELSERAREELALNAAATTSGAQTATETEAGAGAGAGTRAGAAAAENKNSLVKRIAISAAAIAIAGGATYGLYQMFGVSEAEKQIAKLQKEAEIDYNRGLYPTAKTKIRQAVKLADKTNSPTNARNRYLLGLIQYAQGNYDDAQANLETSKSLYMTQGNDSAKIAECEAYLGRAETAMGQFAEAEKDLRHSLQLRTGKNDGKDPEVADSLTGLAYLHMKVGKYQDAIIELRQALVITEKAKGPDSQDAASALNDLGQAHQLANNFKEAESLYMRALAIRKHSLDGQSPFLADSYDCLGALYASTGRLAEAKNYYQQALAIQQKNLSSSDPKLARTRQQYADVVLRMNRH
jgi:serine/threonine protein kinase